MQCNIDFGGKNLSSVRGALSRLGFCEVSRLNVGCLSEPMPRFLGIAVRMIRIPCLH